STLCSLLTHHHNSTLYPYTTLFRSERQGDEDGDDDRPRESGRGVPGPPVTFRCGDEAEVHECLVDHPEIGFQPVVEHHCRHDDGGGPWDEHHHPHELPPGERIVEDLGESEGDDHGEEHDRDDAPDGAEEDRPEIGEAEHLGVVRHPHSPAVDPALGDIARGVVEHHRGGEQHHPEDEHQGGCDPRQG